MSAGTDPAALAKTSARLRLAATKSSDMLFYSKFGKQDASGARR
ncbi:MAG: DUF2478 domain-containing protein [Roseiarcus sp.]